MRQLPLGVRLRDRADFENFHAGRSQSLVDAVLGLLAPDGSGCALLAGPAGSGKSHLLQAACARLPGGAYFPLGELGALGPGVLEGAEGLPVACIDDVQQVAGDPAWEAALFRLHVESDARRGRLLLAADRPPGQLPFRLPDLASRLSAAFRGTLQLLDEAEQREALRRRAALRGLELPDDCASYLQRHFPRDMGTLQGILDQLDQASLSAQRRLTVPFLRETLSGRLPPGE
ncbi:MAG: hypothetical protein RLZZ393_2292 [Pseudomonadota bacterium]|jgi:DnaA family protein